MEDRLALIRKLNEESHMGLLFCYKALKKYNYNYQQAFRYLKCGTYQNSIESHRK